MTTGVERQQHKRLQELAGGSHGCVGARARHLGSGARQITAAMGAHAFDHLLVYFIACRTLLLGRTMPLLLTAVADASTNTGVACAAAVAVAMETTASFEALGPPFFAEATAVTTVGAELVVVVMPDGPILIVTTGATATTGCCLLCELLLVVYALLL